VVRGEEGRWRFPDRPERAVDSMKALDLADRAQWLEARTFLPEKDAQTRGMEPFEADVTVVFEIEGSEPASLRMARPQGDKRRVAAVSSELPGVAVLDGDYYSDLPREPSDFLGPCLSRSQKPD
jgi:hypothetical protein